MKSIVIDTDIPKNVTSNESLNLFESNVNYYVDGETLYIYNPNGGKVIAKSDSKALFSSLTIENIDASGLDVSNCTSLEDVFSSDYYLKNLNISNWDVSNCVNMHALFSDCTNLESLDIKNWNTKNVSIADGMFSYMSNLNDLNCISEWDMSSLHSASNMFAGCSKIANIDITNWNTNNLTYANGMFWNMKGLITLDVSNLNLSKCTNIGYTFGGLYSLKEFKGLENLDVSNVAYAQAAFADLFNLENIDLPSFNCDKLTYTKEMFSDCYKLKSLNLKKFHLASKMTDISYMFNRCKSLENIYVSNESSSDLFTGNSINMFSGCTSLVGGAGTAYDPTFIDATAARIDGGSENPGYFTDIKDKAAESVADQTPSADNSEDEESTDTNN